MSIQSKREIHRRIKSVSNTKKITHTMEMIAAVKMRKAIDQVMNMRSYAYYTWHILCNLIHSVQGDSDIEIERYLKVREPKNYLFIIITSNRGLCGSFNSQISNKVDQLERKIRNDQNTNKIDYITIGNKAKKIMSEFKGEIINDYPELTYDPHPPDLEPLVNDLIKRYQNKEYDRVILFNTDYINSLDQKPVINQLLPINISDWQKQMSRMSDRNDQGIQECRLYKSIIEPNPVEAFKTIFPRLTIARIYHAILESNASKEAARMMAMKNATDTASEMIDDFTLAYNKLRQAKITQEIAEISAGSIA